MKRSKRFLKTFEDLLSSLNTNSHLELSLQKFQHFPKNDLSEISFSSEMVDPKLIITIKISLNVIGASAALYFTNHSVSL